MQLLTWVNEGVRDFSISRSAVQWGINIPDDPAQTVYVWFDALLGELHVLFLERERGRERVTAPVSSLSVPTSI